jgi:hypothetical protein
VYAVSVTLIRQLYYLSGTAVADNAFLETRIRTGFVRARKVSRVGSGKDLLMPLNAIGVF